ncbi:mitochondrial uncoupling protein 3-like isoform X2 [Agrilus planipennis]|uniref:Mitochondrial uncoupling protein 3-like isoform X2 n=1 Tax=Agrilus planipennis TaxID=224129 RepID=A0A7F5RIV5_AGRPL|nr:mitochondrial uncoupling protein 3-like isoform X2 [Agrilus planipennis]
MAKIQLHMEKKRKYLGIKPKSSNVLEAIYRAYQIDGIRGMYRGGVPLTILDVIYLLCQMQFQPMTFNNAEKLGLPRPVSISVTGAVSLALTSIFCLPLDVVTTRLLNQGAYEPNEKYIYKNTMHCVRMIIENEGFFGFYKGFVPFFLRSGFTAAFYQCTYHIFVFLLGYEF